MKKRLLKVLTLGLALIMCLSLTACGGETDQPEDAIVLGWIGPLTGDNTIWGTAEMQSLPIS